MRKIARQRMVAHDAPSSSARSQTPTPPSCHRPPCPGCHVRIACHRRCTTRGKERPMPRRTKPAKAKVRAKPSRTAPKREGGRVRDLERQLTEALTLKTEALKREVEALERLEIRDRELAETQKRQTATSEILHGISS